jgi:hypothetical protein
MKNLEILNSEGPILILEKTNKGFKLNFNEEKYKIDITKDEIINFINGKLIIKSKGGKNFNYHNYSSGMRRPTEKILEFISLE